MDTISASSDENIKQQVLDVVRAVVSENTGGEIKITETTNLLETGALDSLSIMQLMLQLSSHFEFEMDANDFIEENFGNVNSLVRLVSSKVLQ